MKLKEDQLRIKDLLKDTITLLCKNGLHYKGGFCVEALIGITLDDEDVFLVNIKESVKNEDAKEVEVSVHQAGEEEESEDGEPLHTPHKQKHRSRKRPPDASPATSDLPSPAKQTRTETDDASNASEMSKDSMFNIKAEPHDDDDLVFIKEEGNDFSSSCSQAQQPGVPYIMGDVRSQQTAMVTQQGYPQNPDFNQSFNTTSADSLPGMSSWDPNQSNMGALNTSSQSFSSGDNQQQMFYTGEPTKSGSFVCHICNFLCRRKQTLNDHVKGVHKVGEPYRCVCGYKHYWRSKYVTHKKKCELFKAESLTEGRAGQPPAAVLSIAKCPLPEDQDNLSESFDETVKEKDDGDVE